MTGAVRLVLEEIAILGDFGSRVDGSDHLYVTFAEATARMPIAGIPIVNGEIRRMCVPGALRDQSVLLPRRFVTQDRYELNVRVLISIDRGEEVVWSEAGQFVGEIGNVPRLYSIAVRESVSVSFTLTAVEAILPVSWDGCVVVSRAVAVSFPPAAAELMGQASGSIVDVSELCSNTLVIDADDLRLFRTLLCDSQVKRSEGLSGLHALCEGFRVFDRSERIKAIVDGAIKRNRDQLFPAGPPVPIETPNVELRFLSTAGTAAHAIANCATFGGEMRIASERGVPRTDMCARVPDIGLDMANVGELARFPLGQYHLTDAEKARFTSKVAFTVVPRDEVVEELVHDLFRAPPPEDKNLRVILGDEGVSRFHEVSGERRRLMSLTLPTGQSIPLVTIGAWTADMAAALRGDQIAVVELHVCHAAMAEKGFVRRLGELGLDARQVRVVRFYATAWNGTAYLTLDQQRRNAGGQWELIALDGLAARQIARAVGPGDGTFRGLREALEPKGVVVKVPEILLDVPVGPVYGRGLIGVPRGECCDEEPGQTRGDEDGRSGGHVPVPARAGADAEVRPVRHRQMSRAEQLCSQAAKLVVSLVELPVQVHRVSQEDYETVTGEVMEFFWEKFGRGHMAAAEGVVFQALQAVVLKGAQLTSVRQAISAAADRARVWGWPIPASGE
jgi:hypothetical protein